MWQTIQLLLGPDEHSKFLMEAVRRWDIKDPTTGEVLPKILPRSCFPSQPDKHMVAWYEGVSERLRTEAEEEMRKLEDEKEEDRSRVALRGHETDDEESVDSRGPALAYFRNPLYRHVDGKPTASQHGPRQPGVSPRPSSLRNKSKEAATRFGHVMRNVASPHLWDGHGHERDPEPRHGSRAGSRDRDRERKRRSLPHHLPGDPPPRRDPYDEQLPPPGPVHAERHSRRRSSRLEPRPTIKRPDDGWDSDGRPPSHHSPQPIREATSLHRRNVIPRTTSNQRNLSAAVVPQLTRTRRMHHLANLDLVHHLVPRPLLCLHHRLHVSHHKFLRMALAESLRFLDRHPHLL